MALRAAEESRQVGNIRRIIQDHDRGSRIEAVAVMKVLRLCFDKCDVEPRVFLGGARPLDHPGVVIVSDDRGAFCGKQPGQLTIAGPGVQDSFALYLTDLRHDRGIVQSPAVWVLLDIGLVDVHRARRLVGKALEISHWALPPWPARKMMTGLLF